MALILVVDDDDQIRALLKRFLSRDGYQVLEASNGRIAVDILGNEPVDLVITDLIMPDKEGLETIREIVKEHKGLKIIAISGGGRVGPDSYLTMAKMFGASAVFTKPLDMAKFLSTVAELLGCPKD